MKMLGKLGWHGQCSCCSGPSARETIKAQEERQWRAELEDELDAGVTYCVFHKEKK